MLRLETYPDLFKYAKELLDDDYNHGQQLVIKTKNRSVEGNSVSILEYSKFIINVIEHISMAMIIK